MRGEIVNKMSCLSIKNIYKRNNLLIRLCVSHYYIICFISFYLLITKGRYFPHGRQITLKLFFTRQS